MFVSNHENFALFNNHIAIDKDDTLNFLTYEICKMAGIHDVKDIPSLDEIKAKKAPKAFYDARTKFFSDASVFASPPYGGARKMVDMAKESGFFPKICTKTMTTHPQAPEITMHKMKFWQEYFSDIEMHIVTGGKSVDAIALIDDSANNGLAFNKTNSRHFLVWSHKYQQETYEAVLKAFYDLNSVLFNVQDAIKKDFFFSSNLYFDFQSDVDNNVELVVQESSNLLEDKEYATFCQVFDDVMFAEDQEEPSNTLHNIKYKGCFTGDINDLVPIVKKACENMEYDLPENLILVYAYNLINAKRV